MKKKKTHLIYLYIYYRYLKPGLLNDRIVINANTLKVGRTLGFAEAIITHKESGDVIAKGSHTKFVGRSAEYDLKNA